MLTRALTGLHISIEGVGDSDAKDVAISVARKLRNRKPNVIHCSAFSPSDTLLDMTESGVNMTCLSPTVRFGFLFGQFFDEYCKYIEPMMLTGGVVIVHRSIRSAMLACESKDGSSQDIVIGASEQRMGRIGYVSRRPFFPNRTFLVRLSPKKNPIRRTSFGEYQRNPKSIAKAEERLVATSTVVPDGGVAEKADWICNKIYEEFPIW